MIQVQDSPEPDQLLATLEKWVSGSQMQGGKLSGALQHDPHPDPTLVPCSDPCPRQETIEQLLSNMLEGEQSQSVIVSGIQVLLTLLEPRRPR